MTPPSATLGDGVQTDGGGCRGVSVTDVVAAAGLIASVSKLPPDAVLMLAETLPASAYTSSPGAATLTLPELDPAAMTIVAPLDGVAVSR